MRPFDPRLTPWQIDPADFQRLSSPVEKIRFLLRYAVLAPSGHNTQPWRFEISDRGVQVYADDSRGMPETDPDNREMHMSIGAAIFNLRVAAAHFGYHCAVLYTRSATHPALLASIDLFQAIGGEAIDEDFRTLFDAIAIRRTNRSAFKPRAVVESNLEILRRVPQSSRAAIRILTEPQVRTYIAQLAGIGDRIQMADPELRRELARWVRPENTTRGDGLTTDALGIPPLLARSAGWYISHVDAGSEVAGRSYRLIAAAPALAILEAEDDTESLMEAGELLERLLLTLTSIGLQYSVVNEVIQVPGLRRQLRRLLHSRHPPQMVLRIGYGQPPARPAPRRPLDDVVRG